MACSPSFVALVVGSTVVLTASAAEPQGLVTAEREAFTAIARAGEAIAGARGRGALLRAAEHAVAAAGRARDAFTAADLARDVADARYRAARRDARASAVTCANGYPCTNGRLDPFEGVTAAFAEHFGLLVAVSAANGVYVDAVGIPGADAARARAARIRELAACMRDLETTDRSGGWSTFIREVSAEIDASALLHRRARDARYAGELALVEDVNRVMVTLYTAAVTYAQSSPGGRDDDGAGDPDSAQAVAPAAAGDGTPTAMRAALDAARDAMEALRTHISKAVTSVQVPADYEVDSVPGDESRPRRRDHRGRTGRGFRGLGARTQCRGAGGGTGRGGCRGGRPRFRELVLARLFVHRRRSACDGGGDPRLEPHGRRRPASIRPCSRRAGSVRRSRRTDGCRAAARPCRLHIHRATALTVLPSGELSGRPVPRARRWPRTGGERRLGHGGSAVGGNARPVAGPLLSMTLRGKGQLPLPPPKCRASVDTPKSGHWWTLENRPFRIAARDVDAGRERDVPARHDRWSVTRAPASTGGHGSSS